MRPKRSDSVMNLPYWVERPPGGSRGLDPLGLQARADSIADRLLPNISVLTWRARYFSFLCWARLRAQHETNRERAIHRWEVSLAFREDKLNRNSKEHGNDCPFVGSLNITQRFGENENPPLAPEQVYRTSVWQAYRASLAALGFVTRGKGWPLTIKGKKLAQAWARSVPGPKSPERPLPSSACLSEISDQERVILKERLGIALLGSGLPKGNRGKRLAFYRECRPSLDSNPHGILPRYEQRKRRPTPVKTALHDAAVWERVSLGLNAILLAYAHNATSIGAIKEFETALTAAIRSREPAAKGPLQEILVSGDLETALRLAVAQLRRARQLLLPEQNLSDDLGWARNTILAVLSPTNGSAPSRASTLMKILLERHRNVKADASWFKDRVGWYLTLRPEEGRPKIPKTAQPHAYRIAAFGRLVYDLCK